MKIDFVIGNLSAGGAERVMVLLANYFASKKKHQVTIITFTEGEAYSLDTSIKRVCLHGGSIKNHKIRSLLNMFSYYRKKENRPAVLISFITQMNMLSILVAKFFSIKIIVSEHINHLSVEPPVILTKFTRNYLYRMANIVTVLTAYDIDYYERKGGKVVVMPNPCTFKSIEDLPLKREPVILAVGNLDRYYHKGFDNLIPIVAPVLKENPLWKLKIVGKGNKGLVHLKKRVTENNIEDQVIFTGFQERVDLLMQDSNIFILPSRFEGLPMVLLEAMSQGMVCIAYDCITGPSDIITDQLNGLLIEDQNDVALQQGLRDLIANKDLRKRLRKKAITSLNGYTIESIANKWEQLFKKVTLN